MRNVLADRSYRLTAHRRCFVAVMTCFAFAALCANSAAATDVVFPTAHWEVRKPRELGLDDARLDAVATALRGRGCAIKNGYIVKTWGSHAQSGDWFF